MDTVSLNLKLLFYKVVCVLELPRWNKCQEQRNKEERVGGHLGYCITDRQTDRYLVCTKWPCYPGNTSYTFLKHTHTHTHTHTYIYRDIHTHINIHAHTHTYIHYKHTCIHYTYAHIYVSTHTIHAHTHTHTHTHTYIYIYIYIYMALHQINWFPGEIYKE